MPRPPYTLLYKNEPPPPPPVAGMPQYHDWVARQALVEGASSMGQYRLLLLVGTGPVCEVFVGHVAEAADQGYGHNVLIRRLRHEHADDADINDLLKHGAQQAVPLNHAGLPMVLDVGEHLGRTFVVTELVSGAVSLEWICRGWRLPLEVSLHLVARAAEALDYAHRRPDPEGSPLGLLHHDLHPGRVLVGRGGEVKVTGLAIGLAVARLRHEDAQLHDRRRPYLPPEQQHGPALDARANVYSLGAILHQLLTDEAPPPGTRPWQARLALAARAPGDLSAGLMAALESVVRRALEPAPGDRYPSAGALQQDLWKILARQGVVITSRHISELVEQMLDWRPTRRPTSAARADSSG